MLLEHEHPNDKHYTESFLKPFAVPHDVHSANIYFILEHLFGSSFFLHEHPNSSMRVSKPNAQDRMLMSMVFLQYSLVNIQLLPYL